VRAIVTGGAGFIGSHLVDTLVGRGDDVAVVDNFSSGKRENLNERARLVEDDIRDELDIWDELRPDVCFHLAAQADVNVSVQRPDYDAGVNVLGTVRILEGARLHGTQVVFASTGGAIYGECDGPAAETAERRPMSPYGIAKLAGEEYLAGWNRLHGTRHIALRFANVYGPRQDSGLEGGVVSIFLERMARGEPTTIYGDGEQSRDYVYVDDVVRAALAAAGHGGGVFNVGTGTETSVNELHAACRRVAGTEREPQHAEPRLGDVRRSVIDPALAERELGWRAETSLDAGLRITWEWTSGRS
jgi:UDP-glucose 4-epimerase